MPLNPGAGCAEDKLLYVQSPYKTIGTMRPIHLFLLHTRPWSIRSKDDCKTKNVFPIITSKCVKQLRTQFVLDHPIIGDQK